VVKGVTGRFLDVPIGEAVRVARESAGDGAVMILGANVARQCLEGGLLDEIIIHLAPVSSAAACGCSSAPARADRARADRVQARGQDDRPAVCSPTNVGVTPADNIVIIIGTASFDTARE
jgi:dihydrofolate reductase